MHVKYLFDAAKYGIIFYKKYIGHDLGNLVIEILFIIFGYI